MCWHMGLCGVRLYVYWRLPPVSFVVTVTYVPPSLGVSSAACPRGKRASLPRAPLVQGPRTSDKRRSPGVQILIIMRSNRFAQCMYKVTNKSIKINFSGARTHIWGEVFFFPLHFFVLAGKMQWSGNMLRAITARPLFPLLFQCSRPL
jgi:hypothetical protein